MSLFYARKTIQPAQRRHLSLIVGLQILLAIVVVVGTLLSLRDMREEVLTGHLRQASLRVRGFEDHVSQNIYLVSLTLASLPELIADPALENTKDHGALLESIQRQMPALRSLSIADAKGRILVSSSAANVGMRVNFSAYLPMMDEKQDDVMRFGVPREGRDFHESRETNPAAPVNERANYFLPVVQYLPGPSGMIAIAAINPDYFANHIMRYMEADLGHVGLFDYQGITALTTWAGHQAGSLIEDQRILDRARTDEIGEIPDDMAHGRTTLTVYRSLRNYPFFVLAHIDREAALAKWRKTALTRLSTVALALLSTLFVTGLLTLRLRALFVREAQLQEEQRLAASVFTHSYDGIMVTDAKTHILAVNPAFSAITGYAADEIAGKTPRILASGYHSSEFYADMWQKIKATGEWQGDIINRSKDGVEISEQLLISSIRNAVGEISNYVGVFKDLTKLRDSERTIRQMSMAVEQSRSSIVVTSSEPAITYVNPYFTVDTGYLPEEVIGQNPNLLQSALTPPETYVEMWGRLKAGFSWDGELINRRKDGSIYHEHATIAPVKDLNGNIINFVAIKHNITERKRLEQELLQAKEAAEAANQTKSQFMANMSHEIRTPMNGVIGMTGLLLQSDLTDEQRRNVQIIRSSGELLMSIINEILDFSKIEAGKVELELVTFDTADVLRDLEALLSPRAAEKGIHFSTALTADYGGLLEGDINHLRQILLNLAGNALKFTPEGGSVSIAVTVEPADFGMARFICEVRDTGIGIPEGRLGNIFAPFVQADNSTTRQYGGTGLGLTICKQLVELMNGEIQVTSKVGEGSCFSFTFSFACRDRSEAPDNEARPTLPPLTERESLRIMVVEDNEVNQMVLQSILKKMGYVVQIAGNGQECLDLLKTVSIDLILMDCQMPVMDGYEAVRRIRAGETGTKSSRLPIIAMTANAFAKDRQRCLEAGMDDYLSKPVEPEQLDVAINHWYQCKNRDH